MLLVFFPFERRVTPRIDSSKAGYNDLNDCFHSNSFSSCNLGIPTGNGKIL